MRYDTGVSVGRGAVGEVFKAWDPELERWVALKFLRFHDSESVARMFREARAQARIDHPGICKVYEVGEHDGRPFIAMQYIDGKPLGEAATALPLEKKVELLRRVCEAVQAAHSAGLIHRDLKPANILVAIEPGGDLTPYVVDFGIAREQSVVGITDTSRMRPQPVHKEARTRACSVKRVRLLTKLLLPIALDSLTPSNQQGECRLRRRTPRPAPSCLAATAARNRTRCSSEAPRVSF